MEGNNMNSDSFTRMLDLVERRLFDRRAPGRISIAGDDRRDTRLSMIVSARSSEEWKRIREARATRRAS